MIFTHFARLVTPETELLFPLSCLRNCSLHSFGYHASSCVVFKYFVTQKRWILVKC